MSNPDQNVFQDIAELTGGVVTPANAVSVAGFAASMHGIGSLDSWRGITETATGFALDVVDGKVARATGTSSALGEAIDASLDKVKTGYLAARLLFEHRAPKGLVGAVVAQNALNALITLYDKKHNETPQVHPVRAGKYGMFVQNTGLGLHAIGSKLKERNTAAGMFVKQAGNIIGYTGVALSLVASVQYANAAKRTK